MICVKFPAFCDLRADLRIRLPLLLQTCVDLRRLASPDESELRYPIQTIRGHGVCDFHCFDLGILIWEDFEDLSCPKSMPYIPCLNNKFLTSKAASSQKTFQFLFVKLRSWGTSVFKPHLFLTDAGPKFDKFERKRKRETWNSLQMLNETLSGFGKTNRQFVACARSWLYGGRGGEMGEVERRDVILLV